MRPLFLQKARTARSGVCWFCATCLTVTAFILVLAAIDVSAVLGWSRRAFALLVLSAIALAGVAMLMVLAFKIERRGR